MSVKRTEHCLGYLTGKCIHESCKKTQSYECYPPRCHEMNISSDGNVTCLATGEVVNPWEVCLKCNPKDKL